MGEPFIDMSDHLLCDSAVATAVPHDDERDGVEPYTSSIAMKSGWTWKIPMLGRFGSGYVYSSQFATQDEATEEFCALWGLGPETRHFNQVRFRVGRNRRAWVKNCVGIGLVLVLPRAAGVDRHLLHLRRHLPAGTKHFPDRTFRPDPRRQVQPRDRDDVRRDPRLHPGALLLLAAHRHAVLAGEQGAEPGRRTSGRRSRCTRPGLAINQPVTDESNYYGNFEAEFRNFWTNGSYYCILTGMGVEPDRPLPMLRPQAGVRSAAADALFANVKQEQEHLAATLPSNYEYLRRLHGLA